jgi:hypothetical protein
LRGAAQSRDITTGQWNYSNAMGEKDDGKLEVSFAGNPAIPRSAL